MDYTDVGVVYSITNIANGKQYIGGTITPPKVRWNTHKSRLRRGCHHSYKLQSGWNKYGEQSFEFKIILICSKDQVLEYETRLMPLSSYNILKTPDAFQHLKRWAGHVKKVKPIPASRSQLRTEEWANPEIREKRIAGLRAANKRPEVIERHRNSLIGRVMPKSAVQKSASAKWKPVFCKELQCTFLSQKHCAEFLGVLTTSVNNAIKNKGKVSGKFTLEKVA
jgi:group I intron endonuclease